jgi:hypothetical protein
MTTNPAGISKNSRYKQGVFVPKNPEKYFGKAGEAIVYRSSWEQRAMKWFDENQSVIAWNSEGVTVNYYSELDSKMHRYFVDFIAKMKLKDGSEKTYAIEVKPEAQCKPPTTKNKKRLLIETIEYVKNQAKWKAAKAFFEAKGVQFIVITEFDLGISSRK